MKPVLSEYVTGNDPSEIDYDDLRRRVNNGINWLAENEMEALESLQQLVRSDPEAFRWRRLDTILSTLFDEQRRSCRKACLSGYQHLKSHVLGSADLDQLHEYCFINPMSALAWIRHDYDRAAARMWVEELGAFFGFHVPPLKVRNTRA